MTATKLLIFLLTAICLVCLAAEQALAARHRRALGHVVYVNGTRGKSTVTRLIDAGLRAGGLHVFCKTTGTLPMTIGVDGVERPIVRRGRANIKEQLAILRQAASQKADVLVIECMAVDPALQAVSQHRMLKADLGVITNVRLDHTAEMGQTLEEICDSLCNTIPRGGRLFTADADFVGQIQKNAAPLDCAVTLTRPDDALPSLDFPENLSLALGVCMALGVGRQTALDGMSRYRPDPYALSLHQFSSGAIFVNGMSINDPQSTALVADQLMARADLADRRLVLLINNRPDRGYRTEHMLALARRLAPDEIWLIGASQGFAGRKLRRQGALAVHPLKSAAQAPFAALGANDLLFAVGNIADAGHELMARVREEAAPYVQ